MPKIHRVRRDIEDTVIAFLDVFGLERDPNMIACRIQNALRFKRQGNVAAYNSIVETLHSEIHRLEDE